MNIRSILALYKKEMKDILRDKKTLLMMIIVPIILYPLLLVGMVFLLNSITQDNIEKTYKVAFVQVNEKDAIEEVMVDETDEYEYKFQIIKVSNAEKALKNKKIDVYVTSEKVQGQINYTLYYISSINNSKTASSMMENILLEYREQLRENRILDNNLEINNILYPITVDKVDGASNEEAIGSIMGSLIPFLLITTILLGAIYPAIDVTAGEKERGTLETLLTLPVSNVELIMSKFFAVCTVAIVSATLNMASMGCVSSYFLNLMSVSNAAIVDVDIVKFIPAIILMILCVMAFAMFVSAVCVCICIFAKSFKEAQNYSTPILLVFMLAGYAGMIPGVELTSTTAAIPIVNIALLIEDIFNFNFNISFILIALFTNIAYSFIAIWIMSKCFNSEGILFGESASGLKLIEKRINMKEKQIPTIGDVVILFSVLLLFMLYFGSYATLKWGLNGVLMQQLGILLIPIIYAWYMKCDVKRVFSLSLPSLRHVMGSISLWGGAYILMIIISVLLVPFFPESIEQSSYLTSLMQGRSVVVTIFIIAIMPAIGEEIMFRGFLFGSISKRWRSGIAIVVSGFIFGIYHGSVLKFFVIGILGCALAYAVYQSGSILCSMIMHLLNNILAILITFYPLKIARVFPVIMENKLTLLEMVLMIIISIILLWLGILLLQRKKTCISK